MLALGKGSDREIASTEKRVLEDGAGAHRAL